MSGEAAQVTQKDDGILIVDVASLGDTRTFPERVFDMVSKEDAEDHCLILWEEGGDRFAMAKKSCRLRPVLVKHIGKISPDDFEKRLFKHGWQAENSSSYPSTHVAYRITGFRRGMDRADLKDIKRVRRSVVQDNPAPAAGQQESRDHLLPVETRESSNYVSSEASAAPEQGDSDTETNVSNTSLVVQNPKDGSLNEQRRRREHEGETNDVSGDVESNALEIEPQKEPEPGSLGDESICAEASRDDVDNDNAGNGPELGNAEHWEGAPADADSDNEAQDPDVIEIIDDNDDNNGNDADHDDNQIVIEIDDDSDVEFLETVASPNQQTTATGTYEPSQMDIYLSEKSVEPLSTTWVSSSTTTSSGSSGRQPETETISTKESRLVATSKVSLFSRQKEAPIRSISSSLSGTEALAVAVPARGMVAKDPATQAMKKPRPSACREAKPPPTERDSSSKKPSCRSLSLASLTNASHSTTEKSAAVGTSVRITATQLAIVSRAESHTNNSEKPSENPKTASLPHRLNSKPASFSRRSARANEEPHDGASDEIVPASTRCDGKIREPVSSTEKNPMAMATVAVETPRCLNIDMISSDGNPVRPGAKSIEESLDARTQLQFNSVDLIENMAALATKHIAQREGQQSSKRVANWKDISDDVMVQLVRQTWKAAQQSIDSKNYEVMQESLIEKRNKVVHGVSKRKTSSHEMRQIFEDRLSPMTTCFPTLEKHTAKRNICLTVNQSGRQEKFRSCRLEGADAPQPRHNTPISLRRLQFVNEEKELLFVPYVADDDNRILDQILSEHYDTAEREKRLVRGAVYEEERVAEELDFVLKILCQELFPRVTQSRIDEALLESIRPRLGKAILEERSITCDWFDERFDLLERKCLLQFGAETNSRSSTTQVAVKDYKSLVDSYRSQFCARCFTYNCSFHGNGDAEKPSLELQYEKAIQRAEDGYWESMEFAPKFSMNTSKVQFVEYSPCKSKEFSGDDQWKRMTQTSHSTSSLSPAQEALCQRFFLIFGGDVKKMSTAVKAQTKVISDFIASQDLQLPKRFLLDKKGNASIANTKYTSMRNYNPKWVRNIDKALEHPWCQPCSHDERCSEISCLCVQSAVFCTKSCSHAEYSPNFFRGCECNGACSKSFCSCLAANRECDPDLCKTCGACTDPPDTYERVKQKCLNDNMSMRRHRRLLVGKSTVEGAGWGLFNKDPLKKGDFIHEYIGELTFKDEGDRRGHLYDYQGCNYLLSQSTEYDIDATLKGNKVRFGNHSDTPNVDTRKMFINGNVRIGFYANQKIDAQSELFINYGNTFKGQFMKYKLSK